jgi:hypothetical protein
MTPDEQDRRLARIRASIADRFAGTPGSPLQSIGLGRHVVVVRLKPDAVSIAEDLLREFGGMIEISVGFKDFPAGTSHVQLPHTLQSRGSPAPIRATCEVDATVLRSGAAASGKVAIQNTGNSPIRVSASAGAGWLCRPGTLDIVGGYSGFIADAGHLFNIGPGGSETLNFVVGTASSEPGAGYLVPPGQYEVLVPVELEVEGGQGTALLLARDCFIEVT